MANLGLWLCRSAAPPPPGTPSAPPAGCCLPCGRGRGAAGRCRLCCGRLPPFGRGGQCRCCCLRCHLRAGDKNQQVVKGATGCLAVSRVLTLFESTTDCARSPMTMPPMAPAFRMCRAFSANMHWPRCSRAMWPRTYSALVISAQPL